MTLRLSNPEKFNIPRAEQVLSWVITHPELHDQGLVGAYDCDTPGCIAGWTCHFSGIHQGNGTFSRMDLAAQLLGLVEPDEHFHDSLEIEFLFGSSDAEALEIMASYIEQARLAQHTQDDYTPFTEQLELVLA